MERERESEREREEEEKKGKKQLVKTEAKLSSSTNEKRNVVPGSNRFSRLQFCLFNPFLLASSAQ